MWQLKIYDVEEANIFEYIDGGVEYLDDDVAHELCEAYKCEDLANSETADWRELDERCGNLLDYAMTHDGFSDELRGCIAEVYDNPDSYSPYPFTLAYFPED